MCPLTALKFAELTVKAGFPKGVINVTAGAGSLAGNAIARHPLVRKLGFTGSTPIGQTIMTTCAQSNIKKCSLELGGKSPLVIFADCDLDKAIKYVRTSENNRSNVNVNNSIVLNRVCRRYSSTKEKIVYPLEDYLSKIKFMMNL